MKTKKTKKRKMDHNDTLNICRQMLEIIHANSKEIEMDYGTVIGILSNLSVSFVASVADDENEFMSITGQIAAEIVGTAAAYMSATNVGNQTAH
jgi:hypothetical protein